MLHDWNTATTVCNRCGITLMQMLFTGGHSTCTMKTDPNDVALFNKPCCGGVNSPLPIYNNGKWHDPNCDTLKAPVNIPKYGEQLEFDLEYKPQNNKKCTCGSAALGSDRHSDWCDGK